MPEYLDRFLRFPFGQKIYLPTQNKADVHQVV
jgi:hypothetical protein